MSVVDSMKMDYQKESNKAWMINTDGRLATSIKNYLVADDIPEEGAATIISNAAKILGYCPNPSDDEEKRTTGIVIGKVQSGKTSNFISLTALAFDNGYTHVVVFGGTKKILVKQNSERIKEYFNGMSEVVVLNTTEHREYLTEKRVSQFINTGRKVIIVALKTPAQIEFIRKSLFCETLLSSMATLIIDDEGDEASLNTLVSKGKKSSTYLAIEKLKSALPRHSFVSVTATPQANLLISSMDILSPDYGVLVDPGNGYCGLDVFHCPGSSHVVEIPDDETSLLDDGIPNSFYAALATFFVACGIYEARGKAPGTKLSMLIHPSQLKVDHGAVYKKVDKTVNLWREFCNNKSDIAYLELKTRLEEAYDQYAKANATPLPPFDKVEEYATRAIDSCGLHLVNGDSVPNGADEFYDYNIYVGGAMLGRGLTLKGLAITYIIRTAKGVSSVDTVQQRARWFGYKTEYLDLCRVYAVKKIIKEFKDIREHENDLWDTVREENLQGTDFKNIARIFVLSDNLRMTRTSVAKAETYAFKPWNIQRSFLRNKEYSNSNKRVLDSFRKKYERRLTEKRFGEGAPYIIAERISLSEVMEGLLNSFIFPDSSRINNGVFRKLAKLLGKKGMDPFVDVIWMRDGITSKHIIDDDDIQEYMVGRRPEDYDKPAVYEGDRYAFVKEDTMQLQIHMIEDKNTGDISPAVALYIPKDCIESLTNLVIRV